MSIGVLGDITFEATADKQRTWQEASRSGASRWATHDVFAGKPVKEFLGPGLAQIHLSVRLDIQRGVVPRDELRKMRLNRDTGAVLQFTVGGELVGDFVIADVHEEWRRTDRNGVLITVVAGLQLEEYK
jgi:phage protein U